MSNKQIDLSIALAAIRIGNWKRLYDSIVTSVGSKYTFELIFCGPHENLPSELQGLENVRLIQDFGCPTRAQQIACIDAKGRYLAWTADDGWFLPGKLEECLNILENNASERKCLVTHYSEGGNAQGLSSYSLNFHEPARSPYFPDNYLVFNSVILQTEHYKDIGGLDAQFEVLPMAFCDYGVRTHRDGIDVILHQDVIFECTHFPGRTGDHAPIHDAQTGHDMQVYRNIYNNPNCIGRIKIDLENWKNAPARWVRRFGA